MHTHTVGSFITLCPITIGADQKMSLAQRLMREHGIRHLPVLSHGRPVGVISERDVYFLGCIAGDNLDGLPVEDAMTREPFVVEPETSLERVAFEMARRRYGSAIVMAHGSVVGIFTTTDAMRALGEVLAEERLVKSAMAS